MRGYNSFISVNGTAEQTTLRDASMDMIVAGQAFHWFDTSKTKTEFRRISKQHTCCVIIWNERSVESSFEKAYEQLLFDYAIDYREVNHKNVNEQQIADFFSPSQFIFQKFPNKQIFDFEGVQGRLLSSSYTPEQTHPRFDEMIQTLQKIFEEHAVDDRVQFNYETKLYAGKMLY